MEQVLDFAFGLFLLVAISSMTVLVFLFTLLGIGTLIRKMIGN